MASSKEYLDYVLEQLSETGDVTSRAMMGEYILYFRGKVIGGIHIRQQASRKARQGGSQDDARRFGGAAL